MAPCDAQALIAELQVKVAALSAENESLKTRVEQFREYFGTKADEIRKQCDLALAQHQRLSAENAGLREDKARIDWLGGYNQRICNIRYHANPDDLRQAIDAARGAN
jgi:hypothetical protein